MKLKKRKVRLCKYCCRTLPKKNWNTCDYCKKEKYGKYNDYLDAEYIFHKSTSIRSTYDSVYM